MRDRPCRTRFPACIKSGAFTRPATEQRPATVPTYPGCASRGGKSCRRRSQALSSRGLSRRGRPHPSRPKRSSPRGRSGERPRSTPLSERERKLTAAIYAQLPGVFDHVRQHGRLPANMGPAGGAETGLRVLVQRRGIDIELTESERLVYDVLGLRGEVPAGCAVLLGARTRLRPSAPASSRTDGIVSHCSGEQKASTVSCPQIAHDSVRFDGQTCACGGKHQRARDRGAR